MNAGQPEGVLPSGAHRFAPERIRTAPVILVSEPNRTPLAVTVLETLEIGRDCDGLLLRDASISRRHIAIHTFHDSLVVNDLGSLNGSTIDGKALTDRHHLVAGEIVRFGECTLSLVAGASPTSLQRSNAARTLAASGDPRATSIGRLADVVLDDRSATAQPMDPGTVTIVFTDIEGSTARGVELGDVRWHEVLSIHNEILRTMLARHRGTESHSLGDGFMMCFRSARSALSFVVDAQRALAAYGKANPEAALRIRAGIHTGEAVMGDDGDLFGRHVVMAARIADQAAGGEILVSSLVREIVEPRGDVVFGEPRSVSLKGLSGVHQLHQIVY